MLQQIWDWFLQTTALFVTPDWGSAVALLPVGVFAIVALWLVSIVRKLRGAPPARRGKVRIQPRTPEGIHMPGPSFSPIFAAIGSGLLFFGAVYGGPILLLGVLALVLTLLYWLAEGIRVYDHDLGPTVPALPVPASAGPPPGVHMPGPSFRPLLGAIGTGMLMFGAVYGGWLLIAGVVALILTLVGWLTDALVEYRHTVAADQTGHLVAGPAPRIPSLLFWALAIVFIGGALLQAGILPPKASGAATAGASGSPAPSGAGPASGGPPASGAAGPSGPAADVHVTAQGVAFLDTAINAPAGKPFTIAFDNEDAGTSHNIEIVDAGGKTVFKGEIFPGVATKVYDVPALPAGTYPFHCTVHPTMTGSATLR